MQLLKLFYVAEMNTATNTAAFEIGTKELSNASDVFNNRGCHRCTLILIVQVVMVNLLDVNSYKLFAFAARIQLGIHAVFSGWFEKFVQLVCDDIVSSFYFIVFVRPCSFTSLLASAYVTAYVTMC
eukprot:m.369148 g.369148  ORF g.369148 m.369148 type:complete len:126 (-) comp48395_c0_seq1:7-384(-)